MTWTRRLAGTVLPLLLCGSTVASGPHPALAALPPMMLWAWERPEDLSWLRPAEAGVAFLATRIELAGERTYVRPRRQPLQLPEGIARVPVVHVDPSFRQPPAGTPEQRDIIVEALLQAAQAARVVQLDFEVRRSLRPFLAEVVRTARARLPADVALSMTALASWCAGDYWLSDGDGLPADEIVPMAFRMAEDSTRIRSRLSATGQFDRAPCRQAIGLATDEPPLPPPRNGRVYLFAPRSWTAGHWQAWQNRERDTPGGQPAGAVGVTR